MKAYIPSNLEWGAERHSDKYNYILTLIYYGRIFDKRNDENSFIPLNAKILHSILSGNHKDYINALIEKGIIETNNRYIVTKQSKGYRFTTQYRNVKFKQLNIMDKNIKRKIELLKEFRNKEIKLPQHKYIYECLKKISINEDEARYFIEHNTTKIEEYVNHSISVDLIVNRDYFFVADSTAGRVHNNITNLSSDLRQFLRYENNALVEIDIRNSQPFLFNLLIQDYIYNSLPHPQGYDNKSLSYGTKSLDDIELYRDLTSKGMFYEYLMPYFLTNSRDEFKKNIFGRVFYNDENRHQYEEWFSFQDIFPNVAKIISWYKKDNYKNLAIELQRAEAEIMINGIVPRLAAKEIFLLTIHDSILTTQENVETVSRVILEEFQNRYNLIPTLKIK